MILLWKSIKKYKKLFVFFKIYKNSKVIYNKIFIENAKTFKRIENYSKKEAFKAR